MNRRVPKKEYPVIWERFKEGWDRQILAEEYGVSYTTISNILIRMGYEKKSKPSDDELYTKYVLEDFSHAEMVAYYGVSASTMYKWLHDSEIVKEEPTKRVRRKRERQIQPPVVKPKQTIITPEIIELYNQAMSEIGIVKYKQETIHSKVLERASRHG